MLGSLGVSAVGAGGAVALSPLPAVLLGGQRAVSPGGEFPIAPPLRPPAGGVLLGGVTAVLGLLELRGSRPPLALGFGLLVLGYLAPPSCRWQRGGWLVPLLWAWRPGGVSGLGPLV